VQTTFIFIDLSIPNFILGEFEGFEKPVGQFRPNVQYTEARNGVVVVVVVVGTS
jgi:hypothetical protein